MIVRSSVIGWDEALCALQGYAVGLGTHLLRHSLVVNPINSAVFFGGLALTEKLFFQAPTRYLPGPYAFLGPIPVGIKSIFSYGFATFTTLKIMQLAGLILSVPAAIVYLGYGCALALALGCLKVAIEKTPGLFSSIRV